jgi:hypothetical protein
MEKLIDSYYIFVFNNNLSQVSNNKFKKQEYLFHIQTFKRAHLTASEVIRTKAMLRCKFWGVGC